MPWLVSAQFVEAHIPPDGSGLDVAPGEVVKLGDLKLEETLNLGFFQESRAFSAAHHRMSNKNASSLHSGFAQQVTRQNLDTFLHRLQHSVQGITTVEEFRGPLQVA